MADEPVAVIHANCLPVPFPGHATVTAVLFCAVFKPRWWLWAPLAVYLAFVWGVWVYHFAFREEIDVLRAHRFARRS